MHAWMVGSVSRRTEVLPTVIGQQGLEVYRMHVALIPEGSNCEDSLTQDNQISLANHHCQNTVPDSQYLYTLTVGKCLLLHFITKLSLSVSLYVINNDVA